MGKVQGRTSEEGGLVGTQEAVNTTIIQVPFDSGHKNERMGCGPARLLRERSELPDTSDLSTETVEIDDPFPLEVGTAFQLAVVLSDKVRQVRALNRFPLVLAGNCMSSIGTLAGLGDSRMGVIWLDAHGDFNTPETTASGFLDGMALATVTGRCWQALTAAVPGFHAIPECNVVLVGARDLDSKERESIQGSSMQIIEPKRVRNSGIRDSTEAALSILRGRVERVYLHVDLDVLDVEEAHVNQFSSKGGLALSDLLYLIQVVRERFTVAAASITAYDPVYDCGQKAAKAGVALMKELMD
jgi:arginase